MMQRSDTLNLLNDKAGFGRALINWYDEYQRDLPWRQAPTLYKTVVSEFMLQQTQVVTVLPYFKRWLAEFPDFKTLAEAPESAVIKQWEGLGYYTRARNLKKLAMAFVNLEAPPQTPEEWQALPGVGPYTAAAISSIAQGYPQAVIDGNVVRIATRLTAEGRLFGGSAEAHRFLSPLVQSLLNTLRPGDHNQAMMELGATVCTKANPLCIKCPVSAFCEAFRLGTPEAFPVLVKKVLVRRQVPRIFCVHEGALLLEKRSSFARRLADIYELPHAESFGLLLEKEIPVLIKKRGIAQEIIEEPIYQVMKAALSETTLTGGGLYWVPISEIEQVTLSGPHRRWVKALLEKLY